MEQAEVKPEQHPGECFDDFQWAGSFGDRQLRNLEDARRLSVDGVEELFSNAHSSGASVRSCDSLSTPQQRQSTDSLAEAAVIRGADHPTTWSPRRGLSARHLSMMNGN